MNNEFGGYVIYCKESGLQKPFGVVSEDFECKAESNLIPSQIKHYLVQIEDKRFFEHGAIDMKGISRALVENFKAGKIVQGGSTITQQLARNLLKDNSQTLSRKVKEIIKAIQIENQYTKDEILNLYFNNIYFGKNIRGIRTAGLCYFGKEIDKLSRSELLFLVTILRGPNFYLKRPQSAIDRYKFLNNNLYDRNQISKGRHQKNLKIKFKINDNQFQCIKNVSIPFITEKVNNKKKQVYSTIDSDAHHFARQFVSNSKYPSSIIIIKSGKVIGFSSTYGTDYPFVSKSNVGSTLKPFLYCYFRDNGLSKFQKFDAFSNSMNWPVKEVERVEPMLNIQEALFHSNNNAFLNAANEIGYENCFQFLAKIFNRDVHEFYPSSILGATKSGISLYELALAYSDFFSRNNLSEGKIECLSILNSVFYHKLGYKIENVFLKTGTTNNNKERYAVLGNAELTFAVLRNENPINERGKEGTFMSQIAQIFAKFLKPKNNYSWI